MLQIRAEEKGQGSFLDQTIVDLSKLTSFVNLVFHRPRPRALSHNHHHPSFLATAVVTGFLTWQGGASISLLYKVCFVAWSLNKREIGCKGGGGLGELKPPQIILLCVQAVTAKGRPKFIIIEKQEGKKQL